MKDNLIIVEFEALPLNQWFSRAVVSAYMADMDPNMEDLTEIKTAVSEAVSNAIIHGYCQKGEGKIRMEMRTLATDKLSVKIIDWGKGIEDVEKAREPLFTTASSKEQSGMGFTVMETFVDKVTIETEVGKGTAVTLIKKLDNYYEF